MAYVMVIEVQVTVNDDTQAEKIMDAVQSGLAETAIKDRVLYGGTTVTVPAATAQPTFASEKKKSEASKALKPVAVHAPKSEVATQAAKAPKERARGVMGRNKLSRVGGN